MSPGPCRMLSVALLTTDQALQLRKLIALRGAQGTMRTLGCGVAVLDAIRSGVAQPKTVARVAARLDQIREGR